MKGELKRDLHEIKFELEQHVSVLESFQEKVKKDRDGLVEDIQVSFRKTRDNLDRLEASFDA